MGDEREFTCPTGAVAWLREYEEITAEAARAMSTAWSLGVSVRTAMQAHGYRDPTDPNVLAPLPDDATYTARAAHSVQRTAINDRNLVAYGAITDDERDRLDGYQRALVFAYLEAYTPAKRGDGAPARQKFGTSRVMMDSLPDVDYTALFTECNRRDDEGRARYRVTEDDATDPKAGSDSSDESSTSSEDAT